MSVNPVLSSFLSPAESPATAKDSPEKIRQAASQFEALLIGEVLKTVHSAKGEGWMGTGDDESSESTMALGDEYFARAISERGGLGLAKMISAGLEKREQSSSTGPAAASLPNR